MRRGGTDILPIDSRPILPVSTTRRLARLHREEGRPAQAVPLYRGLLKAEPVLEDVVRDLYRCYRELGDLAALIREDRHLRQALRETLSDPDDPDDASVSGPPAAAPGSARAGIAS